MKRTYKMIIGYLIGGLIALVLIPSFIFYSSKLIDNITIIRLINNSVIQIYIEIVLFLVGLIFAIWSLYVQNKIGKGGPLEGFNIEISPKTQKLVIDGPYKYTRNPMIFGAFCIYSSEAVYIDTLSALVSLLIVVLFFIFIVIKQEEQRLFNDFGSEYEEYRKSVSLIIPWFRKKRK